MIEPIDGERSFQITTGLASTYAREFESREEAWNELTEELNNKYGIPKAGVDNRIVCTLKEEHRITSVHVEREMTTRRIQVAVGYLSMDWDGEVLPDTRDTNN
jgi:hypothetical protein